MKPNDHIRAASRINPDAQGALELITHGLQHVNLRHESDRRQSLISFDNAIEVMARTWVFRNPETKKRIDQALIGVRRGERTSQYITSAIAALRSRNPLLNLEDIRHIHRVRNELYHEGKALYPDRSAVLLAKQQARAMYQALFGADAEQQIATLSSNLDDPIYEQISFLAEMQRLTEALWELADAPPTSSLRDASDDRLAAEWQKLMSLQDTALADRDNDFLDLLHIRHRLIVHGLSALGSDEARQVRKVAARLRNLLDRYVSRVSILARVEASYAESPLAENLASLELIFRGRQTFVVAKFSDGEVKEEDLSYMKGDAECVPEVVRVRKTVKTLNGDTVDDKVEPMTIKTVRTGDLFDPKSGMRRTLRTLWATDDVTFAMVVSIAAREDLEEGLSVAGKRQWPSEASTLDVGMLTFDLIDVIEYNPTSFIRVRIGGDEKAS